MAQWTDNEILFTTVVKEGDIIKSLHFENLLYRDIFELDPLLGFWVNPWHTYYNNENMRTVFIENPGILKINKAGKKKSISFKLHLNNDNAFVVVFTERFVETNREYSDEDDVEGHFPLLVKARQLDPESQWDPHGILISFYMQSTLLKNVVPEVQLESTMIIEYRNFLS